MEVQEAVNKIQPGKYGGSSVSPSTMYHDIPYGGLGNISAHRGFTKDRVDTIVREVGVEGKTFLDIGCAVGGISLGLGLAGAQHVLGVDYDPEAIEVAKSAKNQLGLSNVDFEVAKVDIDWVNQMPRYDVVVWLSNWMWIVKQNSLSVGQLLLATVSEKCDQMVFESAGDDGMAAIPGATQQDIHNWLKEWTSFNDIKRLPPWNGWMGRDVFICKRN